MGNYALIVPLAIVAGALYAAAEYGTRRLITAWRTASRDVYPGSPAHRAALTSVDDRTAAAFHAWPYMSTEQQAAWDQHAINTADTGPRP